MRIFFFSNFWPIFLLENADSVETYRNANPSGSGSAFNRVFETFQLYVGHFSTTPYSLENFQECLENCLTVFWKIYYSALSTGFQQFLGNLSGVPCKIYNNALETFFQSSTFLQCLDIFQQYVYWKIV